jgi:hypothetical protein
MADIVNQQIADALTRRQIQAGRVEVRLRQQILALLALLEVELLAAIKAHDPTEFALLPRRRREVEALVEEELDPLITARYERIATLLDAALVRLAQSEAQAVEAIVEGATEDDEETRAGIVVPPAGVIRRRVTETLFPSPSRPVDPSTTGSDWWTRAAASLSQRLRDTLLVSVSLEESLTQMTRRVRGTSDQAFGDGVMARARQDAQRVLTTQTTNALGEARAAVAGANTAQLILVHSSVLDSRTSAVCLGRNGLKYRANDEHTPIGHTIPYLGGVPYHPACRSSMLPVLEGGGAVPVESTSAWLRRQSPAYQDEVLGPTRARMWRAGKLTPRQLIDSLTGTPLTLEELGA